MLAAKTLQRYKVNTEGTPVRWRGRIEVTLDSKWLLSSEVTVVSRNDGQGLFVTGPERKNASTGGWVKQVRFSDDLQQAMLIAVKYDPDPKPRIDDPQQSMDRREQGKANSNSQPDHDPLDDIADI